MHLSFYSWFYFPNLKSLNLEMPSNILRTVTVINIWLQCICYSYFQVDSHRTSAWSRYKNVGRGEREREKEKKGESCFLQ